MLVKQERSDFNGWLALFICTTGFSGFLPRFLGHRFFGKGGGLMGSIAAGLLLWWLWGQSWCNAGVLAMAIMLINTVAMWAVRDGEQFMAAKWGKRPRHNGSFVTSDFNETNIDEVSGMFFGALTIWNFREEFGVGTLFWLFVMFRILDTLKPWPISYVEKHWKIANPAFSVIIDDVVAGLIAGLAVLLAMAWEWHFSHNSVML